MDIENYKAYMRKYKSLMQFFMLLDVDVQEHTFDSNCSVKCNIIGANQQFYTLRIAVFHVSNLTSFECSCPDYIHRQVFCKHIYWFCFRVLGVPDIQNVRPQDIQRLLEYFQRVPLTTITQGRNDTCPICLETIHYSSERHLCCMSGCGNSVHTLCWKAYFTKSYSNKCVFCRTPSMPIL